MANLTCNITSGNICNTSGDIKSLRAPQAELLSNGCGPAQIKIKDYIPTLKYYLVDSSGIHRVNPDSEGNFSYSNTDNISLYYEVYNMRSDSASLTVTSTADTDPFNDSSCKVYLPFDGNYNDLCGNISLTPTGTPVYKTGLNEKKCYYFNGSGYFKNQQIPYTGTITLSVWIKSSGSGQIFSQEGYRSNLSEYYPCRTLYISSTSSNFAIVDTSGNWHNSAKYDGDMTNWHHLVFVSETYNHYLYIDGKQVVSMTGVHKNSLTTKASIGNYVDINGSLTYTCMQQFRIFDRALTTDEINMLYQNQC